MMFRQALARFFQRAEAPKADVGCDLRAAHNKKLQAWLCALAALLTPIAIMSTLEISFLRAVLVGMLLACRIVAIWIFYTGMRRLPFPIGPLPLLQGGL